MIPEIEEIEETQVDHDGSWKDGMCCCNCSNLSVVRKHPWNTSNFSKGKVVEKMGFACTYGVEDRIVTFRDDKHGFCEMYNPSEKRLKYLSVKNSGEKMGI